MADGQTKTYTLEGKNYTVPADTSLDELDQFIKQQNAPPQPNLTTGAGMEAYAQKQAGQYLQQQATAPYEQQQAELQRRKNLAMNMQNKSITPLTNASVAYAPVAAAKSIAGANLLGKAGGAIAGQPGQLAGGLIGGLVGGLPWNRAAYGRAVIDPETLQPRPGVKLIPWMNQERATALGDVLDPNLPKVRNMLQATEESMPNRIDELAGQAKQQQILGQENAAAIKRATPQPELGSPENPGWMSKLPTRMPKPATPQASPIVSLGTPQANFSGSEGRAATWTNEDVMRLAQQGNREAISQAIRRGMQLPENARYVMGDPDVGRAVYNPREVTKFTPEGQPIRNMQNPNVPQSSRARIQLPWEQGPITAPALRSEVQQMATPSGAANVPEWQVGQRDLEITRLKGILRNPQATAEEKAVAQSQLANYSEPRGSL